MKSLVFGQVFQEARDCGAQTAFPFSLLKRGIFWGQQDCVPTTKQSLKDKRDLILRISLESDFEESINSRLG